MDEANLSYIDQLAGDNMEFRKKIIGILKKEAPEEIAVYEGYKSNADMDGMANAVHKIKHKISLLSMEKSYYIAQKYEANLKNSSTELQQDFHAIIENIKEFVNQI